MEEATMRWLTCPLPIFLSHCLHMPPQWCLIVLYIYIYKKVHVLLNCLNNLRSTRDELLLDLMCDVWTLRGVKQVYLELMASDWLTRSNTNGESFQVDSEPSGFFGHHCVDHNKVAANVTDLMMWCGFTAQPSGGKISPAPPPGIYSNSCTEANVCSTCS